MKQLALVITFAALLAACGEAVSELDARKAELEHAMESRRVADREVARLNKEIERIEDSLGIKKKRTTVHMQTLKSEAFESWVEAQGVVESDENIWLSPEVPATITAVAVTEGQTVSRGTVLARLESATLKANMQELETALELAEATFERQEALWQKKIGSEIQYLQAKNNRDGLRARIASLRAQMEHYVLRAPINGVVDKINAHVGELAAPGQPMIRVVNTRNLKLMAELPERYLNLGLARGTKVPVYFKALGDSTIGTIQAVGQVIDPDNRTFSVVVDIPSQGKSYRPNLLGTLRLSQARIDSAIVVEERLVEFRGDASYMWIADGRDSNLVAKRVPVKTGISFQGRVVIDSGLTAGDRILLDGGNIKSGELIKSN